MQIDTTEQAPTGSKEPFVILKEHMKDSVDKYMAQREITKRVEKMIGKQTNRLDINLDELRLYDPELANFVKKNPLESIHMFET